MWMGWRFDVSLVQGISRQRPSRHVLHHRSHGFDGHLLRIRYFFRHRVHGRVTWQGGFRGGSRGDYNHSHLFKKKSNGTVVLSFFYLKIFCDGAPMSLKDATCGNYMPTLRFGPTYVLGKYKDICSDRLGSNQVFS